MSLSQPQPTSQKQTPSRPPTDRTYRLKKMLGKILHESRDFVISRSLLGDDLELFHRRSGDRRTATLKQKTHMRECIAALEAAGGSAEPGDEAFEQLVTDFAYAIFHAGQHLERVFFRVSPESRAQSALLRARLDHVPDEPQAAEDEDYW